MALTKISTNAYNDASVTAAKLDGTSNGVTVTGNLSVDSGTIKLDGNYPTGANNVALGNNTLVSLTTGSYSTALGHQALYLNTSGSQNTAIGAVVLDANTTGSENSGLGSGALTNNTSGSYNTAIGRSALNSNTTASNNTAVGYQAGYSNTTGALQSAFGSLALYSNTTGARNNAFGREALYDNTTGNYNSAFGNQTLWENSTGSNNSAFGYQSLLNNTTASNNVAVGYQAGYSNTTGLQITAVGYRALYSNTGAGAANTATGYEALYSNTTGQFNNAFGRQALYSNTTASYNTAVGYEAGYSNTTATENVFVGGLAGRSTTTGFLNCFVGHKAGQDNTTSGRNAYFGHFAGESATGYQNTYIGQDAGTLMTSGFKNTILGRYNGNQGGLDIRTSNNNIVLSDGDGTPRIYVASDGRTGIGPTIFTNYKFTVSSTEVPIIVQRTASSDADLMAEFTWDTSGYATRFYVGASGAGPNGQNSCLRIGRNNTTSRSINASGTINASGADYAEYMVKADTAATINKGDVCGIDVNGKLTNVWADAISFVVKSTDPSYVGGDTWFNDEDRPNKEEVTAEEYAAYEARLEAARATVDRIAFSGQVPVNVTGATVGDFIVPVQAGTGITGQAISSPTLEQYMSAVGKVIAIEDDGRAKIIVKVA